MVPPRSLLARPASVRAASVPAAATRRVAMLLAGPPRSAVVIHSGADAAYLRLADGGCLGVMAASGRSVPCGLRTTLPALDLPLGARAVVGGGVLRTDTREYRVGRLVDATVPPLPATPALATVRAHPAVRSICAELAAHALQRLAAGAADAVADLLGRGSGLTPVGDDVLAGFLAGSRAARRGDADAAVRREVTRLAGRRTTTLSAQLLACAAAGEVLPEFAALVRDLADPGPALDRLTSVGHTSGAGLALGLTLAVPPALAERTPS